MSKNTLAKLKHMAPPLDKDSASAKSATDAMRMHALADVLKHLSPAA